jgi:hypothetical protein
MLRIRESCRNQEKVCVCVDGRLGDRDLGHFRDILGKYLDLKRCVFVNLPHLTQVGREGKQYLQEMRDQIIMVDLPERLKIGLMNNEKNSSPGGDA